MKPRSDLVEKVRRQRERETRKIVLAVLRETRDEIW